QIPFKDGSALRLTVARYYTPSGRSIQKPYDKGNDEYYKDIMDRAIHGEFQQADSIQFSDSLKYTTLAGRTVYGGGGIMPDFFIPADTLGFSDFYSKITQKGLVYQFALDFADSNRKILSKLTNSRDFETYFKNKDILNQFVTFADQKGIKASNGDLKTSARIIDTQVKAYIARNILGDEGFFPIIKNIDNVLLEAIEKSKTPIQEKSSVTVTK
ncbi:MAG: peptidase S41, partial [Bacteroidota bacterium]|nr:peptidase S41 [Bacteroidota bacterium]